MYKTFKMTDYKSKNQTDPPPQSPNPSHPTTPNKLQQLHKTNPSKSTTPIRLQSSVLHKNINNQLINNQNIKQQQTNSPIQNLENTQKKQITQTQLIYKNQQELQQQKQTNKLKRMDSIHSSQENANIFSQFKLKYDQLKSNYDKLRIQHDQINRQFKKIQIKLFNTNPQYYQKQIKRLKKQLQKYQQENQDNKHKYLISQNHKKQFQASLKIKNQQLSKILKQFEKQKISNVELKHQNQQKQRVFNKIRIQFQKSSQTISKNYDQSIIKINKLDTNLKTKNTQFQQLNKNYQKLDRKYIQLKQQYKKYKQVIQQKHKTLIKNYQTNITQSSKTKSQFIQKITILNQQIEKLQNQRTSIELFKQRKSQEINIIKQNRQLELDVVRLQDKIRNLQFMLIQKDQIIIQIQKSVQKVKIQDQIQDLKNQNIKLKQNQIKMEIQFQKIKAQSKKQIDLLKIQKITNSPQKSYPSTNNFQQILKVQLQENSKLKTQLSFKIDQIYNLKSDLEQQKVQKLNLISEIDIMKKIKKTQQKNAKLDSEIANQYIKSDLDSYKRKIDTLQNKLNSKIKQIKQKDNFIMNSVLGRSKPQDAPLILTDFQRVFQANYVEKLTQANSRIADLIANQK